MQIGSPAPTFELLDQDKNPFSSDSLKGSKSLVVFIPFPFTGLCDDEACALRDNLADLKDLDANVVIITVHGWPVAKKWATEYGLQFPVLADFWPHGATAQAYGAFNDTVGVANRYTFVLDRDGIVRDVINTEALSVTREMDAYKAALAKI